MKIILTAIITFAILFIIFLIFILTYHDDFSKMRKIIKFDFSGIPKWELIFGIFFSGAISIILAISIF
jgi:hypothetical protein